LKKNRESDQESNVTIIFRAPSSMRVSFAGFALAFALLAVAGYAFVTLRGPKGVTALLEKNRQIEMMERRNGALAQEIERKRERVKRLGNDPAEQELEIRQRLKLVHRGEKVFIVGDSDPK
jgi:cell division protein FtsB